MLAPSMRRNRNSLGNVNNTILTNGIVEANNIVPIQHNGSPALESVHINTNAPLQQRRQLNVEVTSMAKTLLLESLLLVAVVDLVAVECDVGHDLVLEQRAEVLLAGLGVEEKGVGAWAETRPGFV
ncbi:hypothetical protein HG531_009392 [Fusarium graminearum]|nr:hypothetical protein HG531_009392 [Fusarium graminearum]